MNYIQKNIEAIRLVDPELYQKVIHHGRTYQKNIGFIKSKSGIPTLQLKKRGNILINSKVNPIQESKMVVEAYEPKAPLISLFLGFGAGYEFVNWTKYVSKNKLKAKYAVVFEKDIDVFLCALNYYDYSAEIKNHTISFFVGIPEEEVFPRLKKWIDMLERKTYVLNLEVFRHPVLYDLDQAYYEKVWFEYRQASMQILIHYGNDPKDSLIGIENILENIVTIAKNQGFKQLFGKFKGTPAVIVSSGPSLKKNYKLLEGLRDKALIFCADGSFKFLANNNLHPHFLASLERIPETLPFLNGVTEEDMKKTYLAGCPVIVKEFYDKWKGKNIITYRKFAHFEWLPMDKGIMPIGASVSNMGFMIAKYLGCDPIILIGQDLSYGEDGKHHLEEHVWSKEKMTDKIPIKGNFTDTVYTTRAWYQFLKGFEADIADYKGTCINATEGGAWIEGSKLMTFQEAIDKYCQKSLGLDEKLEKELQPLNDYTIDTDLHKTFKLVDKTIKFIVKTQDKCRAGLKKIQEANNSFVERKLTFETISEEELNKFYNDILYIKHDIIGADRMFYLFIMHIVQAYLIAVDIEINHLWQTNKANKEIYFTALKEYKNWFANMVKLLDVILESLKNAKADIEEEVEKRKEK